MRCPVNTGLKKKKPSLNVLRTARRPVAEQAWQKVFFVNCYWSHISSNCLSDTLQSYAPMLPLRAGERRAKTRPAFMSVVGRWPYLVKWETLNFLKNLFVPQPPELCNYYVWLITLITLSSFAGECCDWAEMRLIRYQWQVHSSVTRQMLFIRWLVLILLSDVFKSPCCKAPEAYLRIKH